MTVRTIITAAAISALAATSSFAGGLAPVAPDTTVVVPVEPPAQRSSWGIILPILGVALLIGLASSNSSDEEQT